LISIAPIPALAGGGKASDVKQVEDFSQSKVNTLPDGWKFPWFQENKARQTYSVKADEECYLAAKSVNSAIPIAKEFQYELKEYPFLRWQWQVLEFPIGGDERYKKTGDSAAAVYVIFSGRLRPENIKYVWSASLPVTTVLESPYNRKTKIVVLRNQLSPRGTWIAEKVNVYKDFRELFGREPGPVQAIGIMSDSDNTGSSSEAYYRSLSISKE